MIDLAVIIPMHVFDDKSVELLNKAVGSVPEGPAVYLSCKKGTKIPKGVSDRVGKVIDVADGDSFAELVNAAAEAIGEKWFSILEYDDEYTPIWLGNVERYVSELPDVSVFMSLEDITDFNSGRYIGFGNEAAWASSFSDEIGFIDNESLQNYFDFYLTGSVFNTADWNEVGGIKPSMKVSFWYEWMLRTTNKGKRIFVIPKVCYNHRLGREGSLVEKYKEEVDAKETQFWFDLAKREMFFKEDRKKEYVQDDEEEE